MKTINVAMILAVSVLLNACGGGGGGSSSGGSGGGGGSPPIRGGGSSTGGDGNSSYYGFRTTGAEISDQATTPSGGSDLVLVGEFFNQVNSATTRDISLAIFKPTCLDESTFQEYSAVMIGDNGNSNPSALSIMVGKAGLWVRGQSFKYSANSAKRANGGALTTLTGACSNGRMTLDSGNGEAYSNGKMLIYKTGNNDIYMGIRSTALITSSSLTFNFGSYGQRNDNRCSLTGCSSGSLSANIAGTATKSISSGSISLSVAGSGTLTLFSSFNGDSTLFQLVKGSGFQMITATGTVGSKRVILGAMPLDTNCVADTGGDASYSYCVGSSTVQIGIEN